MANASNPTLPTHLQSPTGDALASAAIAGRWLFAVPMALFGLMHIVNPGALAAYVPAWIPGSGTFWVLLSGAGLLATGTAIALNRHVRLAVLGLGTMLVGFILTMHLPGVLDETTRSYAQVALLKDVAILGATLRFLR